MKYEVLLFYGWSAFKEIVLKDRLLNFKQLAFIISAYFSDKRDVFFISNIQRKNFLEVYKNNTRKSKPQLVVDYNLTMENVDRVDQHLSNYPIPRKRGKKFYKKNFIIC